MDAKNRKLLMTDMFEKFPLKISDLGPAAIDRVREYLYFFGFLSPQPTREKLESNTDLALVEFRKYFGISETSVIPLLLTPTCGLPDVGFSETATDFNPFYVSSGCTLPLTKVTYAFGTPSNDISPVDQQTAILNAIDKWLIVFNSLLPATSPPSGPIIKEPVQAGAKPTFKFSWSAGFPQPGQFGDIVAYGTYPGCCGKGTPGECRFNSNLKWSLRDGDAVFNLNVWALHEIGHLFGLNHLPQDPAIMNKCPTNSSLDPVDIQALKYLYRL